MTGHDDLDADARWAPVQLSDVEVRHLRLIVSVADGGSVAAAARALGLPAVTAAGQLRRTERRLGTLFEPGPGGLTPTARGVAVLVSARAVLESMTALERDLWPGGGRAIDVRVAATVLPFETWLPALREQVPGSVWSVRATTSAAGLADVAAARADLFAGPRRADGRPGAPTAARGVAMRSMFREQLWVRLPAGHRAAGQCEVSMAELAGEVWAVPPDADLEDGLVTAARRAGFEPEIRFRSGDPSTSDRLAASGDAISLTAPLAGTHPGVVLRPVLDGPVCDWVVAHRVAARWDAVALAVADVVRAAHRDRAAGVPATRGAVRA